MPQAGSLQVHVARSSPYRESRVATLVRASCVSEGTGPTGTCQNSKKYSEKHLCKFKGLRSVHAYPVLRPRRTSGPHFINIWLPRAPPKPIGFEGTPARTGHRLLIRSSVPDLSVHCLNDHLTRDADILPDGQIPRNRSSGGSARWRRLIVIRFIRIQRHALRMPSTAHSISRPD